MKTLKRLYANILLRITLFVTAVVTKAMAHLLKANNLDPNSNPKETLKDKMSFWLEKSGSRQTRTAAKVPVTTFYSRKLVGSEVSNAYKLKTFVPAGAVPDFSDAGNYSDFPKYVFSDPSTLQVAQVVEGLLAKYEAAKNAAIPFLDPKDVIEIKEDAEKLDTLLESTDVDLSELSPLVLSKVPCIATESELNLWKETFEAAQADPDFKIIVQPAVKSKRRAKKPAKKVPAKPPIITTKPVKRKTKKETKKGKKK